MPDVFPYQILGKGHLARMGFDTLDEGDPPLGDPVAEGKVELLIGEPVDWLPIYDGRQDVLEQGWELLAPLLATVQQVADRLGDQPEPMAVDEPEDGAPEGPVGGLPDLDDITLETLPHARRGLRLTLLELASGWPMSPTATPRPASRRCWPPTPGGAGVRA